MMWSIRSINAKASSSLIELRRILSGVFHRLGNRLDPDVVHLGRDAFGHPQHLRLAPGDSVDALYRRVFPGVDNLPQGSVQDKAEAIQHRLSKLPLNKQLDLRGYPPVDHPHSFVSSAALERIYDRIEERLGIEG